MKRKLLQLIIGIILIPVGQVYAQSTGEQEKLGLPGDNLNLYAVMKLFQESPTLEEFEKKLNSEDSRINNLDLDGDDRIDYIKVIDDVEGSVHNIILQVAVTARENQDVAVFTVDKQNDGSVDIQLTGDEELYGKDYIIEPNTSEIGTTPNPGYAGNASAGNTRSLDDKQIEVNTFSQAEIRAWPIIQVIFLPRYVNWRSPWYWGHYPGWWRPWRPSYWDFYFGYHYNWYGYYWGWYRPWPHHRRPYWNDYYFRRRRVISPFVNNRRQTGLYQQTYSKPGLRKDGQAQYHKINPKLPVLKPGLNKPAPRPGTTKPVKPGVTKPVTKPTKPAPVIKPKPVSPVTRPTPGAGKPTPGSKPTPITKPRPVGPVTKPVPGIGKPVPGARPTPTKPAPVTNPKTRQVSN